LDTTYAQMVPHLVVAGVGLGLVISPVATTVIDAAGERERGVAAALVIILRLVGMTAGVSAMTTYGVRRFQTISTALLVTSGSVAGEGVLQRILEVSAQATVQVVNEVFWMGAAGSLLAVVAGFWLRGETKRPRRLRGERRGLANQED
jgi:MFS family permease